ncbi:MAG: VanW family protein [Bacillota bacterium]|nr:VanW family protein [Bacillota bacterium]
MSEVKRRKMLVGVLGGVIAALLIALGVIIFFIVESAGPVSAEKLAELRDHGVFIEGVYINDISVGGLTYGEATQISANEEQKIKDSMSIPLKLENDGWLFEADRDFGVEFYTSEVLDRAIALGNTDTIKDSADREKAKKEGARFYISYTIDTSPVEESVKRFAATVNRPAVDAAVQVAQLPDPSSSASPSSTSSPTSTPSGSQEFVPEKLFTLTEGQSGITVKEGEMIAAIKGKLEAGDFSELEVPAELTQPTMTAEQLDQIMQEVSSFRTWFKTSPLNKKERMHNIYKAAGLINGRVVLPGEEFSINEALGERTLEAGWEPASGIENGVYTDQPGGGVCQVSTTLYNAVLKADLQVTARKHHSWPSSYVDPGFDATISTGGPDFKFINNKPTPIYIFTHADLKEKYLEVFIYGEPLPDGTEIKLKYIEKYRGPDPTIIEHRVDLTLLPGTFTTRQAHPKIRVVTYKKYYQNGELVKTVPVGDDTYREFNEVVSHAPDWIPPTAASPEPSTTPSP